MTALTRESVDWKWEGLALSNYLQPKASTELKMVKHRIGKENSASGNLPDILIKSAERAEGKMLPFKMGVVFLGAITALVVLSPSLVPDMNLPVSLADKLTAAWLIYAVIVHKMDSHIQEQVNEQFRPAVEDLKQIVKTGQMGGKW